MELLDDGFTGLLAWMDISSGAQRGVWDDCFAGRRSLCMHGQGTKKREPVSMMSSALAWAREK